MKRTSPFITSMLLILGATAAQAFQPIYTPRQPVSAQSYQQQQVQYQANPYQAVQPVAAPVQKPYSDGFYLGVTFGYTDTEVDGSVGTTGLPMLAQGRYNVKGGDYGIIAGYRHNLSASGFFLGAEAEFAFSSGEEDSYALGLPAKAQKRYSYGIYAKPGFDVTERFAVFGTIGWKWAEYKLSTPWLGKGTDLYSGFVFGGGAEFEVATKQRIAFEYQRANYGDTTYHYSGGDYMRIGGTENVWKLAFRQHF